MKVIRLNKPLAVLLLGTLALGVPAGRAQNPDSAPAPSPSTASWTFMPAFVSQYMLRGARLGGPSFEPTIEYDFGALALGIWANTPITDKVVGQSDPEIDPYGSYTVDLVKDKLTLQPGFILYTYPNAKTKDGYYKLTFEPSLTLSWMPAGGWKITPKIYRDVVLQQTLLEFNAAYTVPLKDAGTELDFLGTYGTFKATDAFEDTAPSEKNWGNYWLLGVTVPFQIVKDTQKLLLGFAYTKGSNNYLKQGALPAAFNPSAVGRGVVTIGYAFTF